MGIYDLLVYAHVLAFVFWLGGDLGVAILGSAFRDRSKPLETRLEILRLLGIVDMGPRSAWVVMVPLSITLVYVGGYLDVPNTVAIEDWLLNGVVIGSWIVGALWMTLTWRIHLMGPGPQSGFLRGIEFWLKIGITAAYGILGMSSVLGYGPLEAPWLAWKALTFAGIFVVATMIDVAGNPVGPLLMKVIQEGSSDINEIPLRKAMDRARLWVWATYVLLFVIGYLGSVKPALA
jgi:hypothetical protein